MGYIIFVSVVSDFFFFIKKDDIRHLQTSIILFEVVAIAD
jgi:hypothetical protein